MTTMEQLIEAVKLYGGAAGGARNVADSTKPTPDDEHGVTKRLARSGTISAFTVTSSASVRNPKDWEGVLGEAQITGGGRRNAGGKCVGRRRDPGQRDELGRGRLLRARGRR